MKYVFHPHPNYALDSIAALVCCYNGDTPALMVHNSWAAGRVLEPELAALLEGLDELFARVKEAVDLTGEMAGLLFRRRTEIDPPAYLFWARTQADDPGTDTKWLIRDFMDEFTQTRQQTPERMTEEEFFRWIYGLTVSVETKYDLLRLYLEFDAFARYMDAAIWAVSDIIKEAQPGFQGRIDEAARQLQEGIALEGEAFWERLLGIRLDEGRHYDVYFSIAGLNSLRVELHERSQVMCFGIGLLPLLEMKNRARQENGSTEDFLKALSDPTKLSILRLLREKRYYGGELAEKMGLTAATISHHMNTLSSLRLVDMEKQGARAYYEVNAAQTERYLDALRRMLCL